MYIGEILAKNVTDLCPERLFINKFENKIILFHPSSSEKPNNFENFHFGTKNAVQMS
jgi:hypothetical protein